MANSTLLYRILDETNRGVICVGPNDKTISGDVKIPSTVKITNKNYTV
jgi:hypothetical protein